MIAQLLEKTITIVFGTISGDFMSLFFQYINRNVKSFHAPLFDLLNEITSKLPSTSIPSVFLTHIHVHYTKA